MYSEGDTCPLVMVGNAWNFEGMSSVLVRPCVKGWVSAGTLLLSLYFHERKCHRIFSQKGVALRQWLKNLWKCANAATCELGYSGLKWLLKFVKLYCTLSPALLEDCLGSMENSNIPLSSLTCDDCNTICSAPYWSSHNQVPSIYTVRQVGNQHHDNLHWTEYRRGCSYMRVDSTNKFRSIPCQWGLAGPLNSSMLLA